MRAIKPVGSLALLAGILAGVFGAGRATVSAAGRPNLIALEHGIPVGVRRTPRGALVAAEEYLAVEQETVERDPPRFASVVHVDYAPSIRQSTIAAAAADRSSDPAGMALWANGGQSFTVIGAGRLDWYRNGGAQVTLWAGQVFWGPGRPPTQAWALAQTTLVWRNGRWLVLAMRALPDHAPSPAALSGADPRAETTTTFDSQLRGFTSVSYGAPG